MFDGRRHNATPLIYPYHHAPRGPHTGIVYGRALNIAYASPLGSSLVLSQVTAINMTTNDILAENKRVQSLTPVPLAEVYRRVDGTHLVARVTFMSSDPEGATKVFHKLEAEGNAVSVDTGNLEEEGSDLPTGNNIYTVGRENTSGYHFQRRVQTTTIELELDADQVGHTLRVALYGCAVSGADSAFYRMLAAAIHQEAR
jgi:hypothetical protein